MTSENAIQQYNFNNSPVRTVMKDGEPWFVAKDVANVLEFRDAEHAVRYLDDSEKDTLIEGTLGGEQSMTIISESGMYALVLRSRKPQAKPFRLWVTGEVLPAIRKTGSYNAGEEIPKTRSAALYLAAKQAEIIEKQQAELEANAHKVEFYDTVTSSDKAIDMETMAKIIGIPGLGRNKLYSKLRDAGILESNNRPYQRLVDAGYFKMVETPWRDWRGNVQINAKTVVLPKGQEFIRQLVQAA